MGKGKSADGYHGRLFLSGSQVVFKNSSLQKEVLEGSLLTFNGYSQRQTRREYMGGISMYIGILASICRHHVHIGLSIVY